MKNLLRASFLLVAFIAVAPRASYADACVYGAGEHCPDRKVPEIDPGMGASALALLGGALMVIRSRAKR
jgi:hypothetical protein